MDAIGGGVFLGCENLSAIEFPKSLKTIGDRAFFGCGNLIRLLQQTIKNLISSWISLYNKDKKHAETGEVFYMNQEIYTIDEIRQIVKNLTVKYDIENVYLFGSYARGDATEKSDIDILIKGGKSFKGGNVFSLGEEIRGKTMKPVDIFEMKELNKGSAFYSRVQSERVVLI